MEQTLVSVITPMYNARRYIAQTIESVQLQTYQNWEMIIVDDLSTDGCDGIVQEYVRNDARIRYHKAAKKLGVASARNEAMRLAKGRYLAFLDSDDLWKPEKLEKQLALLAQKDGAFSYAGCDVIDGEGNPISKVRHVPESITYNELLWGNVIPCLTVLVDREKTGDFTMPQLGHEDYATWLTVIKRIPVAHGIDECLATYREHQTSISSNKFKAIRWAYNVYRKSQNLPVYKSIMYLMGHVTQAMRKR